MPFGLWKKKAAPTVDRQRQVDLSYAKMRLKQGDLSFVEGCSPDRPMISLHNISLMEPRSSHTLEGGIKCRIARGLYFSTTQSQVEPVDELTEIDRGKMTITTRGLVFDGKSHQVELDLGVIESIGHTQNGMTIDIDGGRQKLHFEGANRVMIHLKVQERLYSQSLDGKLMRLLVEAAIRISLGVQE